MREPWCIRKQRAIEAARMVEIRRQQQEWINKAIDPEPSSVEKAEGIILTDLDHRILGLMGVKW